MPRAIPKTIVFTPSHTASSAIRLSYVIWGISALVLFGGSRIAATTPRNGITQARLWGGTNNLQNVQIAEKKSGKSACLFSGSYRRSDPSVQKWAIYRGWGMLNGKRSAKSLGLRNHTTTSMCESLEDRRLLSVSLNNGVLRVNGTSEADYIQIRDDGKARGAILVNNNGRLSKYDRYKVKCIQIKAGLGADRVALRLLAGYAGLRSVTARGVESTDRLDVIGNWPSIRRLMISINDQRTAFSGSDFRWVGDTGVNPLQTSVVRSASSTTGGITGPTTQYTIVGTVTMAAKLPVGPTNLTSAVVSSSEIELSWKDNATNETGYEIERKPSSGGTWQQIASLPANSTSYSDSGLTEHTKYTYRVCALNAVGSSTYSGQVYATTMQVRPAAPDLGSATPFSAARIDLTWVDNSNNEDRFVIERSTDGLAFTTIATLAANTTSYSDAANTTRYDATGIHPATRYYYRVRAENSAGPSFSPVFNATTLANATVDAEGWTTIVPSEDSLIIYVSSSEGDDANLGTSPDKPVKTIAKGKSLIRDGMPDWLLLRAGDTWSESNGLGSAKGGRSPTEPLVLSSYGTGARPLIKTTGDGITSIKVTNNVAIIGLHFYAGVRDPDSPDFDLEAAATSPTGIRWLGGSNLLVEDCLIDSYKDNVVFQAYSGPISNLSIRRNVVVDAYSIGSHSQGTFISGADGILLEGNLFDHNGWNEKVEGGKATIFNHNIYMQANCKGRIIVRGNIIANASSHGMQARSGGEITGNLFLRNPIHLTVGNGDVPVPGGVLTKIESNVFLGSGTIDGAPRGFGVGIQNLDPNGQSTFSNNLFVGDSQSVGHAIMVKPADVNFPSVGINNLTISDNVVYGWAKNLVISSSLVPGGTGRYALNNLVVRNNYFQAVRGALIIDHGPTSLMQSAFSGNQYSSAGDQVAWFKIADTNVLFDDWQRDVEATSSATVVSYPDPSRDIGSYNASVGSVGTMVAFLAPARQQHRTNWHLQYTAQPVIDYIHAGFGMHARNDIQR
ncbi:MAG: fibronectin type III domain-containing protein [Bacillota bacterium]